MQAPTTWTRGHGFTRLAAGAIGLTLLAAATLGAAALTDQVDLPLIGGSSDASRVAAPANTMTKAEIAFLEQNSFDYVAQVRPLSVDEIRFLEANIWEREALAQAAGRNAPATPALSYAQMRFLEDNIWERQQLIPPLDTGETDY